MYISTRKLEGKCFFEKYVCVLFFFRIEPKTSGLLANFFRQGYENCFWCVHNTIMRDFFRKNVRYFLALSHTEYFSFGIQSKIFQQGRQRELSKVLITSGHWAKSFRPFVSKVLQGYQNCILRVYRNSLNKKNSWKKGLGFFNIFGHWAKFFWLFINFFSMELSKVSSTCPWEHFDEKCFLKNSLWFQFFFGLWLEKNSAFRQALFSRFAKTAFHVSIDIFSGERLKKKFSTSFLDNKQKLSGCKNSFLRVPRNNLM